MNAIKGIIPPMITPLKGNDELDREGAVRLTEHILAGGVHALFLLGTTGEAQSLTYRLRYEFVELVCKQVAGRVPVLVGVTDTSLDESVKLAAHAAACGAVGVVAAAPYYFAPSQQELIEYYTALADALPLPLYLYNMPSHVKVFLEPATVKTLADHPNIVGLKDSSANMTYFQTLLYYLGDRDDFSLYIGPEELTGESQFSAELDLKATAYIPEGYIESNAGRMDCYKQIAEIRTVDDYKRVCLSIEDNYGPMPDEVLNLLIIAVLKSYAAKFNVRKITVDSTEGSLELPSINSLKDKRLTAALDKYEGQVKLSMAKAPLVIFP